jgi:hypothetical protein
LPQRLSVPADASHGAAPHHQHMSAHLTLAQSLSSIIAAMAAWSMVRLGVSRDLLRLRRPEICPSCGVRPSRHGCRCTT